MNLKYQEQLFEDAPPGAVGALPQTRYQGSKHKIADWIYQHTKGLSFNSVLDAFGGTGSVGYRYKKVGKQVFYNDALKFNYYIGLALIENSAARLENDEVDFIIAKHKDRVYSTFISDTFQDIYFTDEENQWLDVVAANIMSIRDKYKQAIAFYALFQACTIKRPFNLFHRKNLYMRTAEVERSFGNKKTWDTSFEEHFRNFVAQANNAVCDNGEQNLSYCRDIFSLNATADLVYIDTPYISARGEGVNYLDFYHFLEGLARYDEWGRLIDANSKHKRIKPRTNVWCNKHKIYAAFERLFAKFSDSILAVSYRDDGTPAIIELVDMLRKHKREIEVHKMDYKYALSKSSSKEVLIVGY